MSRGRLSKGRFSGGTKMSDTRIQDYEESIKHEEKAMEELIREFDEHEAILAFLRYLEEVRPKFRSDFWDSRK